MKPIEELQKQIENEYIPICIKDVGQKRTETLTEFLVKFFQEWNKTKPTIYVGSGRQQTGTNRLRSLGDIYMICKYYYPTVTVKDIMKELCVTLPALISGMNVSYCSEIYKRVWTHYTATGEYKYPSIATYENHRRDEWGLVYQDYLDYIN